MGDFKFKDKNKGPRKSFKYEDAPEKSSPRSSSPRSSSPRSSSPRSFSSGSSREDSGSVVEMIRKMQQQLIYLERKIDTLIGGSSSRPSRPERSSSSRHGRGSREDSPSRAKNFTKGKKPFLQKRKPSSSAE